LHWRSSRAKGSRSRHRREAAPFRRQTSRLPSLNWEERSDWVNVKTDVAPAAIGDGVADDTAALQKALDGVQNGSTVYLPPGTYRIVSMSAIQALEVLGKVGLRALVNKCCAMPQLILPSELMRDIASGKVFHTPNVTAREMEEVALRLLDPADYPTDLIQPVFEILRKHRQFRAAWIFTYPPAATDSPARLCYHFILLMDPFDDDVYNEFNLVVAASHGPDVEVYHSTIDENDPVYAAKFFRRAHPFYVAADFACSTES